jgi:pimeloyl-ACP methyl ester carboxylesterase
MRPMITTAMLRTMFRTIYGPTPDLPTTEGETGLVLLADGIGGFDLCGMGLKHAAGQAGLTHEVRVVNWGHGLGHWHRDLTNVANHEAKAEAIAVAVLEFQQKNPGAPVFLVGKSGGTGIIVKALERLPDESVERVVLLSSALSPGYDLSKALRAVHHEMTVFWSPFDVFILGVGTHVFGTVDRVNTVSAGLVGFHKPPGADDSQYRKLHQVKWTPQMAPTGNLGGHVGVDSPAFLRKYVVPLLQDQHAERENPIRA